MRKIAAIILSVFFMLFMSACGSTIPETASAPLNEPLVRPDETLGESEPPSLPEQAEKPGETATILYEIGDVIFSDGSVIKRGDISSIDGGNIPVAVIAGFREDGTAFGVGVHRSSTPLQWASDDSVGYALCFTDTVCAQNDDSDFSGDKDGGDNWSVICSQDENAAAKAAENYPAFHFVNTYAEEQNLSDEYAYGWYMPSITELCTIYQNREAVNDSLRCIYELDNQAAMNGLETNWYWASSQAGSEDDYAWFVHFFNGYAGECPKNFTNVHALAVRAF